MAIVFAGNSMKRRRSVRQTPYGSSGTNAKRRDLQLTDLARLEESQVNSYDYLSSQVLIGAEGSMTMEPGYLFLFEFTDVSLGRHVV